MLKFIGVVTACIGAVIVAVLIYAATQPDTFSVRRSASIKAPPEKIYPLISDLHRMIAWSPYEKKDPNMKRTFKGAPSGKGAIYEWDGDSSVGKGSIEIAALTPPSKVVLRLNMVEPFAASNVVEYTLQPQAGVADVTKVTWSLQGPMSFIPKVMCLFFDMDKMVGAEFEVGLANLKRIAEGR